MTGTRSISDHWATGDVFARILEAMRQAGIDPATVTVKTLAQLDHFHARGLAATEELADGLPVEAGDRLLDIGCGIGGPARYFAERFGCTVEGIDITEPFVVAANQLTEMVGLTGRVTIRHGDGQRLPYEDARFDGGYAQHVTMNVADRGGFFGEVFRVLKPGAFFALTEHGLGETGDPLYPLPWSDDGSGAFLMRPVETVALLERAGFTGIAVTETGKAYLEGYRTNIARAEKGEASPFGTHVLLGEMAMQKVRNAAQNIEEGRTRPVQIVCRRPK